MTDRQSPSRFEQRDIGLKADFRGANYEPASIVTKANLKRLEAMRARATPQPALTPRGIDHARIKSETDKLNERQIDHHKTRLMVARLGLNRDRMKAVNKDRAKAGFNQATQNRVQSQRRSERIR